MFKYSDKIFPKKCSNSDNQQIKYILDCNAKEQKEIVWWYKTKD